MLTDVLIKELAYANLIYIVHDRTQNVKRKNKKIRGDLTIAR